MSAISSNYSIPVFITDGLTRKDENGRNYIKYAPASEIAEIRDVLVDGGRLRDVYNENGEKIFTLGKESGIYTAEQIIGTKVNYEA